ncbi:Cyclin, C-terminal domain-containing protein, partial [Cynara cardunculus var. scolymus]
MNPATFSLTVDAAEVTKRNKNRQEEGKAIEKRKWEGPSTGYRGPKFVKYGNRPIQRVNEKACPRCHQIHQVTRKQQRAHLTLQRLKMTVQSDDHITFTFDKFLSSHIAASAVFLAKWTLDQIEHPWNPTLEHYTNYKASDLKATILALQDLQLNDAAPLRKIRQKYKQKQ